MIGNVVHAGRFGEQVGAIIDIDANRERAGLGGTVHGSAGEKFAVNFECASAIGRGFLDARKFECELSYNVEIDGEFFHGNFARSLSPGRAIVTPDVETARKQIAGRM